MLNVLLSFAQFEREIISERTRDKIAATRRKGKWAGGRPILGYDIDPNGFKLLVNHQEAERVRRIYAMYLKHESLLETVKELAELGWDNKKWTTRRGDPAGGRAFDKTSLYRLLSNVAYAGKVRYKAEVHEGEHEAIVDFGTWTRAQEVLKRNGRTGGAAVRNRYGALLKGLLRCKPCGCGMGHSYSSKDGRVRYRYYVCYRAQKQGWHTCPSKSLPAAEIERMVVEQLRALVADPAFIENVLSEARSQVEAEAKALKAERSQAECDLARYHKEVASLAGEAAARGTSARLADLVTRIAEGERTLAELRERGDAAAARVVNEDALAEAVRAFDPVWEAMTPKEQTRVVRLLVQRVEYDGNTGMVSIILHPEGIRTLAKEREEAA